jgi:ATP-binding cassette subfamily C exporter for protease/lipase
MFGDPSLVVLDEPNANLDEAGDAALVAALRDMQREKRTVFVMTHRKNILSVVDVVMVLENGAIRAYGPRAAVLQSLQGPTGGARIPPRPAAAGDSANRLRPAREGQEAAA